MRCSFGASRKKIATSGFLLDGYPRTLPQAKFLDGKLEELGFPKPTIFHLATPQSVLIERISSRRQCPQCGRIYNLLFKPPKKQGICDIDGATLVRRSDDNEEVVRARLQAYEKLTAPIIMHYANGDFHSISANRPPAEIFRDIESVLPRRLHQNGSSRSRLTKIKVQVRKRFFLQIIVDTVTKFATGC